MVSPVQLSSKVVRLDVQAGHDRLGAGVGRGRQGPTPRRRVPLALLQLLPLVPRGPSIERGFFTHAVAKGAGGRAGQGTGVLVTWLGRWRGVGFRRVVRVVATSFCFV